MKNNKSKTVNKKAIKGLSNYRKEVLTSNSNFKQWFASFNGVRKVLLTFNDDVAKAKGLTPELKTLLIATKKPQVYKMFVSLAKQRKTKITVNNPQGLCKWSTFQVISQLYKHRVKLTETLNKSNAVKRINKATKSKVETKKAA